jgi:hypothetical protein
MAARRDVRRVHLIDSRQEHSLSAAAFHDGLLAENTSASARSAGWRQPNKGAFSRKVARTFMIAGNSRTTVQRVTTATKR